MNTDLAQCLVCGELVESYFVIQHKIKELTDILCDSCFQGADVRHHPNNLIPGIDVLKLIEHGPIDPNAPIVPQAQPTPNGVWFISR